jgi:hypothetical protein
MTKSTRRLTVLDLMVLIAGLTVGLWLAIPTVKDSHPDGEEWLGVLVFLLGGLSLAGPVLLLRARVCRRVRLRIGELFWFCQGTATWLLWPPVVYHRLRPSEAMGRDMAAACYFYGTPLMALYVTITLVAGGWLPLRLRPGRRRRRARARQSWTETFGLILGLIWACTGLYLLTTIYRNDFR